MSDKFAIAFTLFESKNRVLLRADTIAVVQPCSEGGCLITTDRGTVFKVAQALNQITEKLVACGWRMY